MTKKGYQKRLPTILPAPRPAPELESVPPDEPEDGTYVEPHRSSATEPAGVVLPPERAEPPSFVPGRRRAGTWLAMVGVAIAVLLVGGLVVVRQVMADDSPAHGPAAAQQFQYWPPLGSSRTETAVRPDGDLEVTHWIHTVAPIGTLSLSLPDLRQPGSITVTAVEVVADDESGSGPAAITFASATYLFAPATRIHVSYRMSGAVQRSTSADGRGLASTTALRVSAPQERDLRVVRSQAVLSLACADSANARAIPCGESVDESEWRVELTGDDVGAHVLAAVTVS